MIAGFVFNSGNVYMCPKGNCVVAGGTISSGKFAVDLLMVSFARDCTAAPKVRIAYQEFGAGDNRLKRRGLGRPMKFVAHVFSVLREFV